MRSSSAEARAAARHPGPVLGRWGRLVLGTLLVGAALLGPAVGYASAQFGDSAEVTITISVAPTTPAPTPAPTATLPLHPVTLVAEERTLKGSYIGTAVPGRDIPRYIELYRRGRLPVDKLLSGTLKHNELNEGFDRLHEGEVVRQVLLL